MKSRLGRLENEAKTILENLSKAILILEKEEYTKPLAVLENTSIGEHVRHIIEFFFQLQKGYIDAIIDYDNRIRNFKIQEDPLFAIECIEKILINMGVPEKELKVRSIYTSDNLIKTTYAREILYNIEHCIHHQAIIKIGLRFMGKTFDEGFGVSKSTLKFRSNGSFQSIDE